MTKNVEMSPTTIASRLRSSSLSTSSESAPTETTDVLRKELMIVSTTTNKIDYILEELVGFLYIFI